MIGVVFTGLQPGSPSCDNRLWWQWNAWKFILGWATLWIGIFDSKNALHKSALNSDKTGPVVHQMTKSMTGSHFQLDCFYFLFFLDVWPSKCVVSLELIFFLALNIHNTNRTKQIDRLGKLSDKFELYVKETQNAFLFVAYLRHFYFKSRFDANRQNVYFGMNFIPSKLLQHCEIHSVKFWFR